MVNILKVVLIFTITLANLAYSSYAIAGQKQIDCQKSIVHLRLPLSSDADSPDGKNEESISSNSRLRRVLDIIISKLGIKSHDYKDKPYLANAKIAHEKASFDTKMALAKKANADMEHRAGLEAESEALKDERVKLIIKMLGLSNNAAMDYVPMLQDLRKSTVYGSSLEKLGQYINNHSKNPFSRAGIIANLEHVFSKERIEDRIKATSISRHYLNQEGVTLPEKLACYYILNLFGDRQEKNVAVKNLLETAVLHLQQDGNWENVKLALTLLSRCDIPDEIRDEVSTNIARANQYETFTNSELCPLILEKVGLSEEALKSFLKNERFFSHIMPAYLSYHDVPTIKMLAKFAGENTSLLNENTSLLNKIKASLGEDRYNNFSYIVFLGNIENEKIASKEFKEILYRSGDRFVHEAVVAYKSFYSPTKVELLRYLDEFGKICYEKPRDNSTPFYLFMCTEIVGHISEIYFNFSNFNRLLDSIFTDRNSERYNSDMFRFAAQGVVSLSSKIKGKAEWIDILEKMMDNTYIDVSEMGIEAARKMNIKSPHFSDVLLGKHLEGDRMSNAVTLSLSFYAGDVKNNIIETLEKSGGQKALNEITEEENRIRTQLLAKASESMHFLVEDGTAVVSPLTINQTSADVKTASSCL
ncbi:MAG: hypothetical protein KKD11_07165 [Candidatus Omnitrophica bacterium]|nr:hypothetical protein [Candidatus Omnitrophota bacterium]